MAVPTYVAAGSTAAGTTGDVTALLPGTAVAGDLLVLYVETANEAVDTPSGWEEVDSSPQGTGVAADLVATRLSVFTRYMQAGDTGVTVVAGSPARDHTIARVSAFRGVGSISVQTGDVASAATTSCVWPAVTTPSIDHLIVLLATNGTDSATGQWTTPSNANLTGIASSSNTGNTNGNGGGIGVFYGTKATAGSTGTSSSTLVTASVQGRIVLALTETVPADDTTKPALAGMFAPQLVEAGWF
jgi:hypothetical protein